MEYQDNNFGRYFEDFHIGDTFEHHSSKIITEDDNTTFCHLTMNHHPLHLNEEYASKQLYKKKVVVGTYIIGLVVGMSVADISGKAIANLDYEKIIHHAPVFIGDTIYAVSTILDLRRSKSKPDRGIVFVETKAYNQKDELVLSLRRHILLPIKTK